jgi:hypothetical protein
MVVSRRKKSCCELEEMFKSTRITCLHLTRPARRGMMRRSVPKLFSLFPCLSTLGRMYLPSIRIPHQPTYYVGI